MDQKETDKIELGTTVLFNIPMSGRLIGRGIVGKGYLYPSGWPCVFIQDNDGTVYRVVLEEIVEARPHV
jgi:hypothetical protein